jgi:hypothetical protein
LNNGRATYDFIPLQPNILSGGSHPYQKLMYFVAQAGQETVTDTLWVLITGHRPREQTFTSTTPELPLFILRDPPGDESYCYLAKDSSHIIHASKSVLRDTAATDFEDLKIGGVFEMGFSVGWFSMATNFGVYAIDVSDYFDGSGKEASECLEITFTAKQEFRTSDDQLVVGPKGDVFIGASFNNLYALTDVIDYDWQTHRVITDTTVVWGLESINTTYIYTEHHIRNTLLPQLHLLRSLSIADTALIAEYNASIDLWQQILAKNDSLKEAAVFDRNISFSSGTTISYSATTIRDTTFTIEYIQFVDSSIVGGLGIVALGVPYEWKSGTRWRWSTRVIESSQVANTTTVGYSFGDGDPGDFFSVDIKHDEGGFGTPVFELLAGTSSCPWEEGSQPRDGVDLSIDSYVRHNVPPDEAAAFILSLGNTSQSGEERVYDLRVIQASNPDGAIIKVGGVPMGDPLSYFIPAGQQYDATLTVERGPLAFDYENLQIMMYPPCEYERWLQNMPLTIADTVTFSVHFLSTCSDVTLLYPEDNWVLNQTDNDSLQFVITDYNVNNPNLESVKFQYRRYGENWETAFYYPKAQLPAGYIMEYWDVSNLQDGNYELRAATDCAANGINYSSVAAGVIDRQSLLVFGTPQPSDGVLNIGEDITIFFSDDIDKTSVNLQNISLITSDDSSSIPIEVACYQNKLVIQALDTLANYSNRFLTATVSGIRDIHGNQLRKTVSWSFRVSLNPVYWTVSNVDTTVYQGEAAGFSRTLKNAGGQSESFTIVRYPSWLTPNPVTGSIPFGGTRRINFSIDTQLAVDSIYVDTVFVNTSYGEEHLIVTLSVLHKPPEWIVNPSLYAYNMNIIAQIVLEDGISKDIYDIISIFVDNECRGKAHIEYVSAVNKYVAFLTIYSNVAGGEVLTFHAWDASKGRESVLLTGNYTFQSNASLGTVANPILIEPDAFVQSLELSQGWNWISLNVENTDMSLSNILNSLSPADGDVIKGHTGFCQYLSGVGWQGNLATLDNTKSYCVNLSSPDTLYFTGLPVDVYTTPVFIDTGWNWIGYLPQEILGINDALASYIATENDRIKSQTEFADYLFNTGTWEGSLKKMIPGQGYLLRSQAGGSLNYPVFYKPGSLEFLNKIFFPEKPDWVVDVCEYEYSISVTGIFEFDEQEMTDSTFIIGAFSGETCCGVTQLRYLPELEHYMAFLLIYSNTVSGDSIHFHIYEPESEKLRDVDETIVFSSDQIIGNLEVPFVFTALGIGDELVPYDFYLKQNYPNPFNPKTTIEYGIPRDEKVKLTIYDILGKKVRTLVNEPQEAGRYEVIFNVSDNSIASGVYFYRIEAGSYKKARKLMVVK